MGPYKVLSSSQMTAGEIPESPIRLCPVGQILKSRSDLYNFLTL
jgi:hypothetical protein